MIERGLSRAWRPDQQDWRQRAEVFEAGAQAFSLSVI
jgi:hypothetical protein